MKNYILPVLVLCTLSVVAQPSPSSETKSTDPATITKEFLNAVRGHDSKKATALLHPDVIWVQPGTNRLSGVKKSREEVQEMGKRMGELSDKSIELAEVRVLNANGNSVACLLRWKAVQPTGNVLDVENIDVYTIENGLIVSVKVYSADLEQENRFW
ncbi:ketosteroid isomerase [Cytophagales bacterium WSM2-2]|nr:ketosteroid isomerase [Cytophagales bacterium WSM2-2]